MKALIAGILLLFTLTPTARAAAPVELTGAAVASAPAVRVNPPAPPPPEVEPVVTLSLCEDAHLLRVNAGLPDRFDYLAQRESKCHNDVRTYCCFGIYQIYWSVVSRDHRMIPLIEACGVQYLSDIYGENPDARRGNTCVAAALYSVVGYQPWRT